MAEPKLSRPLDDDGRAHYFTTGTTGETGTMHPNVQVQSAERASFSSSGKPVQVAAPAHLSTSKLALPIKVVDAMEQISQKTLAQADTVPAAGPRRGSFTRELPPGFMMPQPVRPVFPALMRAAESSLTKAEVRSTLSTSLAPRSGTLPSQPFRHNENTFPRVKSPQVSTPANFWIAKKATNPAPESAASHAPAQPPAIVDFTLKFNVQPRVEPRPAPVAAIVDSTSTFAVNPTAESRIAPVETPPSSMSSTVPLVPARTPSSSGKKPQRSYVLPDGSVTTSGKGLGRGRPGIKRGPRKSKLATEIRAESPKAIDDTIVVPFPQMERKRSSFDESADPATPSEPSSRASSEEFIPENTQTRSGRQALKPLSFVPSSTSTPAAKRPRLSSPGPSIPKPAALAKIKRKTYRGREHAALCEHCLRGHGPLGNVIVFCDACNKCWHQRCHEPQVSEAVIKDIKAEWYCSDCEKIINGPKKGGKKAALKSRPSLSLSLAPVLPVALVGASSLTREQREAQLSALSKDKLIDMLMRATDLAPALPLFENPSPPIVTTPTLSRPIDSYPTPTQEADDYEYLYDEHAALYPRPGNGVKLPPESVDLAMLLEGLECRTFSHTLLTAAQRGLADASA